MRRFLFYICFFILLTAVYCFIGGVYSIYGQGNDSINSSGFPLFTADFFTEDKPLEITLLFDVKKFKKQKSDSVYLIGELSYNTIDSIVRNEKVKIKARGVFRKNHCSFPPFWLNIKDSDLANDEYSELKRIKVVTHCRESKDNYNYVLKEYVAYKLCNIITDFSFKVRLLKITYIYSDGRDKSLNRWAFFIEPEEILAERLDAYPLERDKMNYNQMDTLTTTIMSMFQYMIGNTDHSITGRHNIKLITLKDFSRSEIIPIPYDFDFSGLVNAYYAGTSDKINIESVTERYYYGLCRSDSIFNRVIDLFLEKKHDIYSFINNCDFLSKQTKKSITNYIDDFYIELNNPRFIERYIRTTCD